MTNAKSECAEKLRADAKQNRELILDAAREAFSEKGLGVTSKEVAERAGVGIATLFRRFPSRSDLLAAAFGPKLADYTEITEKALEATDPWNGFCTYIRQIAKMQHEDCGFRDILTRSFPEVPELKELRIRIHRGVRELIRRAQASKQLRDDFVEQDIQLLLMANAGVLAATAHHAPQSSERLIGYFLQAFAKNAEAQLPAPSSSKDIYRAITAAQPD